MGALPCFISFAINFIFGILVYSYNRQDIANKIFRNLVLAISLWSFGCGMNYISPIKEIALRWVVFQIISAFITAPSFAHFCLAISKRDKFLAPPILFFLYLPCLIMIPIILIDSGIFVKEIIPNPGGGYDIVNTSLYPIYGLYLAFSTIIGLSSVIMATKTPSTIRLRRGIFIGFTLAVIPCLIIYFIIYPIFHIKNLLYLGPLFTLSFPCAVGYALIQPDGLMNVRAKEVLGEFLVKSITNLLLILTSLIVFFSVLYFTKWMWIFPFESNILLYLPGLGIATFVTIYFKPKAYLFVYKLIYNDQRFIWPKSFLTLPLNLKKECSNEDVMKFIREQLPKILNTDSYYLLLYDQERDIFKIIDSNKGKMKNEQLLLGIENPLIQRINIGNELKAISEIEDESIFEKDISIFKKYNIDLCLPIKQEKNLLGIVCFGKRNLFPQYDLEQKKEVSKFIYGDRFPYIRGYLENIVRKPPYTSVIYIKDIPDEFLNSKNDNLLKYLLNPDKVKIKIIKAGNKVLTKELNLTSPEKIIFNYIAYKAYINDVYNKYQGWHDIPFVDRVSSNELADSEGEVIKALSIYHRYIPVDSRIRQWISDIRKILTEIEAKDLIPLNGTSTRGRGRGYTINGKIILLKEFGQ